MKAYVNGKLVSSRNSAYYAVWPDKDLNFYISDPWHATGGFTLSKMKWYPFNLTAGFIDSLAMSTFPMKHFTREINNLPNKPKSWSYFNKWMG